MCVCLSVLPGQSQVLVDTSHQVLVLLLENLDLLLQEDVLLGLLKKWSGGGTLNSPNAHYV